MPTEISADTQAAIDTALAHAQPAEYTHGLGEVIRAHRLYIGLSQREMAHRLHKDRRDYQRIENERDACPPGMLSVVEEMSDRFVRDVDTILAAAGARDPADGPLTVSVVTNGGPEDEWQRNVAGRAAVEADKDHPIVVVVATAG